MNDDLVIYEEVEEIQTDKRARCWVFTLNGLDVPFADWSSLTVNTFIEELSHRSEVRFISGCVETGEETNRLHFQGYVEFKKAMRWTAVGKMLDSRFTKLKYQPPSKQQTLRNGYSYALKGSPHNLTYIATKKGNRLQARDYSMKQGAYEDEATCQVLSPISFGDWVDNGQRLDLEDLAVDIETGKSDIEIWKRDPVAFMRHQRMINATRSMLISNEWSNVYREVEVCYISGETRCGKTSLITSHFGYENVHRITEIENGWDSYTNQDVVIFDEFRSSADLRLMLAWLEGHPVQLPARYFDRQAAFTKVFIISNWSWSQQYEHERIHHENDFMALVARIKHILEFVRSGDEFNITSQTKQCLKSIFDNGKPLPLLIQPLVVE